MTALLSTTDVAALLGRLPAWSHDSTRKALHRRLTFASFAAHAGRDTALSGRTGPLPPPLPRLTRYTTRAVKVGGYRIPAGASVRLLIASANRDGTKVPDPNRFDTSRSNAAHAGFGYGIHMCVGSWLAKLEMRLMLENLVATTAALAPDDRWPRQPIAGGAFATVGLHSLGLKVTPL